MSRYWDRITRPEQLLTALPRAVATLTDPAECGPVTLSLCQDVQAEAFDFPEDLFEPCTHRPRRPPPDADELADAVTARAVRGAGRSRAVCRDPERKRSAGMSIRLGTNPIAWSNDDMPELGGDTPLETCLAEARAAGFTGIEKGNKFPADPAALPSVLARHGLQFVSGWYGAELRFRDVEQEIAAMRPHLDLLQACGCEVMVFAETSGTVQGRRDIPVADRPVMREKEWPVFLDRLGRLGDWMQSQGVRIAFHHHMGTVIESAAEIDRMLAGTPESVGLLFDTGHLSFAGEDPAVTARQWAHRINHVHAKDVRPEVLAQARRGRLRRMDDCGGGAGPGQGPSADLRDRRISTPPHHRRGCRVRHRMAPWGARPINICMRGYGMMGVWHSGRPGALGVRSVRPAGHARVEGSAG